MLFVLSVCKLSRSLTPLDNTIFRAHLYTCTCTCDCPPPGLIEAAACPPPAPAFPDPSSAALVVSVAAGAETFAACVQGLAGTAFSLRSSTMQGTSAMAWDALLRIWRIKKVLEGCHVDRTVSKH